MLKSLFTRSRTASGISQMSVQELKSKLDQGERIALVDVRQPREFAGGHVSGAKLLPLSYIMSRQHELPKDQPLALICRSGNRSQIAAEQLAAAGFSNLSNVSGGMIAWSRAGYPVGR